MPPNPQVDGAEKSLRQAAPGGDVIPFIFGLIAALVLLGLVRNAPSTLGSWVVSLLVCAGFALPAYILWAGARQTGLFVTDDAVEYRALGRVRDSWKRPEVGQIVAMSGGAKVVGSGGGVLREYRFRWWRTDQVDRFARAAGLAPPSAVELALAAAANSDPEVDPGEAGKT